ncbi:Oligopeptide-binding protein OppA [Chlamydiales bacterium SCGC AG-110-P3]|nr:Oligopeptide-binding protein OppA [Chlamydiales bacterium SCGC AG-110-P3]
MLVRSLIVVLAVAIATFSCTSSDQTFISTLRIAVDTEPEVFDPGRARSLASTTTLRMIYEGLLRKGADGSLVPGVAERWEVSSDGIVYTFHLRNCKWSNGTPVTAQDFVNAWRRQLDPTFPAPNANQLYSITGAREARNGTGSLDAVGIKAIDDTTLVVTLESPSATFLELTTFHAFFPISRALDTERPSWHSEGWQSVVGNGPFALSGRSSVIKNSSYWDAPSVKLSGVEMIAVDETTALLLFEQGALDWIGSPLSTLPADALSALREKGALRIVPAAGTQFLRFNTNDQFLKEASARHALSYAIDRRAIVDHILQAGQQPATALVPASVSSVDKTMRHFFNDSAVELAKARLNSVAASAYFPTVIISYSNNERYHRLAQVLQQQWEESLGIAVKLRRLESKVLYDAVKTGDYQVAIGSWFADIDDPSNFLEVFESSNNGTNNTGWEDASYMKMLSEARATNDPSERTILLREAERVLMQAMPIAPINTFTFAYLQADTVRGVIFSPLGHLDFRHVSIEETR